MPAFMPSGSSAGSSDPIPVVARALAEEARLLCFDEFQVTDVADAMILGRLFDRLFAEGVTIVATSNTPPDRLYEGGLNRQLFLPFIEEIKQRLEVVELNGPTDYRLQRLSGVKVYLTPLGAEADAAMDAAWRQLTDTIKGKPRQPGRAGPPVAGAAGRARAWRALPFDELCDRPLAAADYLAMAQEFHTILIDHIPGDDRQYAQCGPALHPADRHLYDEGVKLICSAAAPPDQLYPAGDRLRRLPPHRLTPCRNAERGLSQARSRYSRADSNDKCSLGLRFRAGLYRLLSLRPALAEAVRPGQCRAHRPAGARQRRRPMPISATPWKWRTSRWKRCRKSRSATLTHYLFEAAGLSPPARKPKTCAPAGWAWWRGASMTNCPPP